jgi:hypothetical protein
MWPDLLALIRFIIRFCTTLLFPFIHPNQFCTAVARNVRGTKQYALAAYQVARISRQRLTVAASFERQVARRPRALCLSFGAADQPELYSYHDVYSAAQRVANWLLQWPVSEGECVALLMSNRPEFMVTWLGAHYSGACAALLNTNLTPRALQHSVTSVGCCKLIAGEELRSVVEQAVGQGLLQGVCIRFVGRYMAPPPASPQSCSTCDAEIAACSVAAGELQLRRASLRSSSTLYYIFTSGTTGLPKAAAIPSSRFLAAGYGFSALASLRASDKIYCCLPIYHSSGGMLGFSMACVPPRPHRMSVTVGTGGPSAPARTLARSSPRRGFGRSAESTSAAPYSASRPSPPMVSFTPCAGTSASCCATSLPCHRRPMIACTLCDWLSAMACAPPCGLTSTRALPCRRYASSTGPPRATSPSSTP